MLGTYTTAQCWHALASGVGHLMMLEAGAMANPWLWVVVTGRPETPDREREMVRAITL